VRMVGARGELRARGRRPRADLGAGDYGHISRVLEEEVVHLRPRRGEGRGEGVVGGKPREGAGRRGGRVGWTHDGGEGAKLLVHFLDVVRLV
jgi:hypothetical protein